MIITLVCPLSVRADLGVGIGAGIQYGGLVGMQGIYNIDSTNLKLVFGAIGIGAAVEQKITPHVSAGLQVFGTIVLSGRGIFLNYSFSEFNKKGLVIGVDYIFRSEVLLNGRRGNEVFLASIGYKF